MKKYLLAGLFAFLLFFPILASADSVDFGIVNTLIAAVKQELIKVQSFFFPEQISTTAPTPPEPLHEINLSYIQSSLFITNSIQSGIRATLYGDFNSQSEGTVILIQGHGVQEKINPVNVYSKTIEFIVPEYIPSGTYTISLSQGGFTSKSVQVKIIGANALSSASPPYSSFITRFFKTPVVKNQHNQIVSHTINTSSPGTSQNTSGASGGGGNTPPPEQQTSSNNIPPPPPQNTPPSSQTPPQNQAAPDTPPSGTNDFVYDGFTFTVDGYSKLQKMLSGTLTYTGTHPELFEGKTSKVTVTIPAAQYTSVISSNPYVTNSPRFMMMLSESASSLDQNIVPFSPDIASMFPDGTIPYVVQISIGGIPVVKKTSTFVYKTYRDNYQFQIGIVQVVNPGVDITKMNACFIKDPLVPNVGYRAADVSPDCSVHIPHDNSRGVDVRSYSIQDLLFGNQVSTNIPDLIVGDDVPPASTQTVYSLRGIGTYWESLLEKSGLSGMTTTLGKNPHFSITILPPIEYQDTLTSPSHATVMQFFADAVQHAHLDLSRFDFVVYVQHHDKAINSQQFFNRSFSGVNGANVTARFIDAVSIEQNELFQSIAHELGHVMFGLADLYNGSYLQYPKGVPDPIHFPQRYGCIMAEGFGLKKVSDTDIYSYDAMYNPNPGQPFVTDPPLSLSQFHTHDPNNYVLCVDDLVRITKKENPNCSVTDFYAGKCGESCTALNYYSDACKSN